MESLTSSSAMERVNMDVNDTGLKKQQKTVRNQNQVYNQVGFNEVLGSKTINIILQK